MKKITYIIAIAAISFVSAYGQPNSGRSHASGKSAQATTMKPAKTTAPAPKATRPAAKATKPVAKAAMKK